MTHLVKVGRYFATTICFLVALVMFGYSFICAVWCGADGSPNWYDGYELSGFVLASCLFFFGAWGILKWRMWTRWLTIIVCVVWAPAFAYFTLSHYDYEPFFDLTSSFDIFLCLSAILVAFWLLLPAVHDQFKMGGR